MLNKSGVYKIVNKINGKTYYGSTTSCFKKRFNEHKKYLNKNSHHNKHLQAAWRIYGKNNFDFIVILTCAPENCLYYEQLFLDKYLDSGAYCYNICCKAGNTYGLVHSKEVRERISMAKKGIKNKNNGNAVGRKLSNETRMKMSISKIGDRNGFYGKKHSLLSREKIAKKLNFIEAELIRAEYATNQYSQRQLALMHKVNQRTIMLVINNRCWIEK